MQVPRSQRVQLWIWRETDAIIIVAHLLSNQSPQLVSTLKAALHTFLGLHLL